MSAQHPAIEQPIPIAAVRELLKRIPPGWVVMHPANGPHATAKQTAVGLLPGAPDLVVFSPAGKPHFLQFKPGAAALSEEQEAFQLWAIRANLAHSVVRSIDEAMRVFKFWGVIPKA